ncbi:MAG: O-antigen ligase family protein [Candidatus Brocadiia bacterium]
MPHAPQPDPRAASPASLSAVRVLEVVAVVFAALAVALRPLLPGHGDEANLWVELCVVVAAMGLALRMALQRRLRVVRTGMGLPALALLAVAAVSTARSPHKAASVATLLEWGSYALLFLVVATLASEGLDRRFVLRVLWASAFVAFLFGLFQQFVNLPLVLRQIEGSRERVLLELRLPPAQFDNLVQRARGRVFSTFLVPNSFAGFIVLVLPGFLGYALDRVRAGERGMRFLALAGLWVAAALACLLLTYSRGGWLAMGVAAAAFCVLLGRGALRRHRPAVVGLVVAAVVAAGGLFATGTVPTRIFRTGLASLEVRLGYWRGALAMAGAHPVGGVGLGTFGSHYPRYRWVKARVTQEAHNDYLQTLAELGVVGLAAFVWVWAACLRGSFAPRREPGGRAFPRGLGIAAGLGAMGLSMAAAATFTFGGWGTEPWWPVPKAWCDAALVAVLAGAWVAWFALLGRGEAGPPGELCRKGLLCGLIGFLFHCAVDFDYQEPGVALTAWVVAALCVAQRRSRREVRLSRAAAFGLGAAVLVAVAGFEVLFLRAVRAGTHRDLAESRRVEASEASSPREEAELLAQSADHYARAASLRPLDDGLRIRYGALVEDLFWLPYEGPESFRTADRLLGYAEELAERPSADPRRLAAVYRAAAERFRTAARLARRAAELQLARRGPPPPPAFEEAGDQMRQGSEAYVAAPPHAAPPEAPPDYSAHRYRAAALCFRRAAAAYARVAAPRRGIEARRFDLGPAREEPEPLFRQALRLYQRAAALNRAGSAPHVRLAQLCQRAAEARLHDALAPLVEAYAAERPPSGPRGAFLPAVAEFERALRRDPNRPNLRLWTAQALERHGDLGAAREQAQAALRLHRTVTEKHTEHVLRLSAEEMAQCRLLLQRVKEGAGP